MPIEPFAIWNLIKSALDATAERPTPPPQPPAKEDEKMPVPEGKSVEIMDENPDSSAAARACENYLLRHEQLSSRHTNGK